jgi:flagellar biosynthetic protein FlhB
MADDAAKTIPPTPHRRREARRRGQVARSSELVGWLGLLGASFLAPAYLHAAARRLEGLVVAVTNIGHPPSSGRVLRLLGLGFADFGALLFPVAVLAVALAAALNVAQVGFLLAPEAARPKLTRLSPRTNLRRIFSAAGAFELAKAAVKLALVGAVGFRLLDVLVRSVSSAQPVSLGPILAYGGTSVLGLLRTTAFLGVGIGLVDYVFQRRRISRSLMMTRWEWREEMRRHEQDPLVRRRIRQRQFRMSRMRMLAALARADVVVANPTHVAVALRYDPEEAPAPVVLAKGAGELAARIRERALDLAIPVVVDPPLARALYAACDVDDTIPRELYVAVARLLAFVYSLPAASRLLGVVHEPRTSALEHPYGLAAAGA